MLLLKFVKAVSSRKVSWMGCRNLNVCSNPSDERSLKIYETRAERHSTDQYLRTWKGSRWKTGLKGLHEPYILCNSQNLYMRISKPLILSTKPVLINSHLILGPGSRWSFPRDNESGRKFLSWKSQKYWSGVWSRITWGRRSSMGGSIASSY